MNPDDATRTSDQATPGAPAVAPVDEAPPVAAGAEAPPSSSDATDAPAMPSSSQPEAPAAPAPTFSPGQLVLLDKPRAGVTPSPVFGAIIVALAAGSATIVELGPLRVAALDELRPV
jgi:hypothetical protein